MKKLLVIATLAAIPFTFTFASTDSDQEEYCTKLGLFAGMVADLRDAGFSETGVRIEIERELGKRQLLARSESDMREMVGIVYEYPRYQAVEENALTYLRCLQVYGAEAAQ